MQQMSITGEDFYKKRRVLRGRAAQRGVLMIILIVLTNGIFFLLNLLSDGGGGAWKLLIINTIYAFILWVVSEYALDAVGKKYPNLENTQQRVLIKLITFFAINAVLSVISTYACLALGIWNLKDHWLEYYSRTFGMVCFFGGIILAIYEALYLFRKWKAVTVESEQLKREHLQTQLDSLKNQVNPHFLFNSLNSLSSLIEEDETKAQLFVNELARVYRYLLQSNERELTDLKSELSFIKAYFFLLKTRFGDGICLDIQVSEASKRAMIPPLTLQLLIENAVKHNVISTARPLYINIYDTASGAKQGEIDQIVVSNNLQSKTITVALNRLGLANIDAKYRLLAGKKPIVEQTETTFSVKLPLLSAETVV